MTQLHSLPDFLNLAAKFRGELAATSSFNEIRALWLSTSYAYEVDVRDPLSPAYREAMLNVYGQLAGGRYDVGNELTSTKQNQEQFERGYPWLSENLEVIGSHLAKVAQAVSAIGREEAAGKSLRIIEFGSGWGELAIPLAKAGKEVTCVDIDAGFISRLKRIAEKEKCSIKTIEADFCPAARQIQEQFDCVIFQSSFHHCLEFDDLIEEIERRLLAPEGKIFFFAEPIFRNYAFPWGLRFDGESLWAIMCNGWLELGFDYSFFSRMLLAKGMFMRGIPGIGSMIGEGFFASRSAQEVPFRDWLLPLDCDETWHAASASDEPRFAKARSTLPGLIDANLDHRSYDLRLHNFSPRPLSVRVTRGRIVTDVDLAPGASELISIKALCPEVVFECPTYIPNEVIGNGDTRALSFAISRVKAY